MIGPEFSVGVGEHGGWVLVTVAGELDMSTSPKLGSVLEQATANGSRMIVDLSDVTFLDSSALGVLIAARNTLSGSGGELQLVVASAPVHRVLEVTGLLSAFPIHESLSAVPDRLS